MITIEPFFGGLAESNTLPKVVINSCRPTKERFFYELKTFNAMDTTSYLL